MVELIKKRIEVLSIGVHYAAHKSGARTWDVLELVE